MIDYKKVETAQKLLEESGAQFVLAYDKGDKHCSCRANGQYPTIKKFIITVMWQVVENVYSQCGVTMASSEVFSMTSAVLERLKAKEEDEQQ
ncbi:hypothetical protein [Phascolarctobacterium succinatutens]|uniref:hypothetical protein n=1 Tax=Phascolarctobacterium succinatutens TaxID=626940 RepID=UPI0026EA7DF1|nr:hypothetical protein [Phascolarctobacterium succinatutens]